MNNSLLFASIWKSQLDPMALRYCMQLVLYNSINMVLLSTVNTFL